MGIYIRGRPEGLAGHGYTRGPGEDDGFGDIPNITPPLTARSARFDQGSCVVADAIRDELRGKAVQHNVGGHDRDFAPLPAPGARSAKHAPHGRTHIATAARAKLVLHALGGQPVTFPYSHTSHG